MTDNGDIVASHLGTFRPSDREALSALLRDGAKTHSVLEAVKFYVCKWEESDWLEAYSLERIGKWIAMTQAEDIIQNLENWSRQRDSEARLAFLAGLDKGRQLTAEPA